MFDNVWERLKSVAKVLWIISLIIGVVLPFIFAGAYGVGGFFIGIVVSAVLLISEFISCAAVYALGIATENAFKAKLACDFMIQQHKNSDKVLEDILVCTKELEGFPEELKKLLEDKTNEAVTHKDKHLTPNVLDTNDILDKIRQYKELLTLGVITEERFESMKQDLLSSI